MSLLRAGNEARRKARAATRSMKVPANHAEHVRGREAASVPATSAPTEVETSAGRGGRTVVIAAASGLSRSAAEGEDANSSDRVISAHRKEKSAYKCGPEARAFLRIRARIRPVKQEKQPVRGRIRVFVSELIRIPA